MQSLPPNKDPYVQVKPVPPDQISPKAVVLRLMRLKNVFRRNWLLLLALVGIGGLIGFIYDQFNKKNPIYNASITFNLGGGSSGSSFGGDLGSLASAFGIGQGAPDANIFVGENFLVYALSRPVVEKTLMKTVNIRGTDTLLANYYIRHSGIRDKEWEDSDTLRSFYFSGPKTNKDFTKLEQIAMAQIYGRIKGEMGIIEPNRKSSFMELRCGMEDEMLATRFIETHLETIEQDYRSKQSKKTNEMYDLLKNRADSIARLLTGTESRLAQYMDQNQQVIAAQGQMIQTKLTRNSTFLTTLYYQAVQNAENMRLTLIREQPLFTVIEPVQLPLYREVITPVGMRIGIALGLIIAIIVIFIRETYRSIMTEG